ncbi:MAG: hypothetical protein ACI88G_002119, partial [Woeseiaceae bacterium]
MLANTCSATIDRRIESGKGMSMFDPMKAILVRLVLLFMVC